MHHLRWIGLALVVTPLAVAASCSGDDNAGGGAGSGGTGGSASSGTAGGTTGSSGATGTAGNTGTGGAAGTTGAGGRTGTGGTGGAAGKGGTAGSGGTGGTTDGGGKGGAGGTGGSGGTAGGGGQAGAGGAPTDAGSDASDGAVAALRVCMAPGWLGGGATAIGDTCATFCTTWVGQCLNSDAGIAVAVRNFYGAGQAQCETMCNALTIINDSLCCRFSHVRNVATLGADPHCAHATGQAPCM